MKTTALLITGLLIALSTPTHSIGFSTPMLGSRIVKPEVSFPQAEVLKVDYIAAASRRVVGVRLENRGQQTLRCQAEFRSGHEVTKKRITTLAPNTSRSLAAPIWRSHRVNIDLSCTPV